MTATAEQIRRHRNDYADYVRGLRIDGYEWSARGDQIDYEVVQEFPCEECGGDCRYEAWRRAQPRGYRALSVCRQCGYTWEL